MGFDKKHPEYNDLKNRIREDPKDFVALVGAGLSMSAGIPNWQGLRDLLVEISRAMVTDFPPEEQKGYLASLDRIACERDLWQCFSELKKKLPVPAYEGSIAKALTLQSRADVPKTYDLLWKMDIKGIVTFNLDKCSIDSYARVNKSSVDSATSDEFSRYATYLTSPYKFVFQPHGIITNTSTWVFTISERTALLGRSQYVDFMKSLFHSKHILLIGFNPGDFAFEYLLQSAVIDFRSTGVKHYAILPSPSPSFISSLGERGIGVVTYRPDDIAKHSEVQEMLEDILGYVPQDVTPATVFAGQSVDPSTIPSPSEIVKLPLEETRALLNKAISAILPPGTIPPIEALEKAESFYKTYIQAIYNCWLIEPDSDFNMLHGYRIVRSVGRGAFGQVYEAENSETKDRAAVKILLPEVKNKRAYLNSFRRGVNSMSILTSHDVKGMVKFKAAYEIPACVFMDFIDGPTLSEAKEYRYIDTLPRCLESLISVGDIVHSAHNLDERVLHRDLKPSNVLVRNCYSNTDDIDIVVLDFDLSWHKGALDVSVVHGARAQGYAAPEQTATGLRPGTSTRNTAVDVFGFGMLGFFLLTGEDPRPNEQNFPGFNKRIGDSIDRDFRPDWLSLSRYLAHTIDRCTKDIQSERIGFSEALEAFRISHEMASSESVPSKHPLILLEIACRVESGGKLSIRDFDRQVLIVGPDTSKEIAVSLGEINNKTAIHIRLSKVRSEFEERNVAKYLQSSADKSISQLRAFPFDETHYDIGQSRIDLIAEWCPPKEVSLKDITKLSNALANARAGLIFA